MINISEKSSELLLKCIPEIYGGGLSSGQENSIPHFYPFKWVSGESYDGSRALFCRELEYECAVGQLHQNGNY